MTSPSPSETPRISVRRAAGLLAALLLIATPVTAQHLRLAEGTAPVTQWRNAGDTIATLQTGTLVDLIDREGSWFWVVLPADPHGTRRVGWVHARMAGEAPATPGLPVLELMTDKASPQAPPVSMQLPPPVEPTATNTPRWLVQGIGGLTMGHPTGGLYAGGLGVHVSERLIVTGEAGRMNDIAPESLAEEGTGLAAATAAFLGFVTGRTFQVASSVSMPATYGLIGARVLGPPSGAARPYATGGIGFARVAPRVVLVSGADDVTFALLRPSDFPAPETAGLFALGGGVTVRIAEGLGVDVGYRYARITASSPVHVNRVYAAIGYGF